MEKSNKLLDNTNQGDVLSWRDIILLPFLFLLALSVGRMLSTGIVTWITQRTPLIVGQAYSMYVEMLLGFGLAGLMLFLFVHYTNKEGIKSLGIQGKKGFKHYFKGVGIAVGGMLIIIMVLVATGQLTLRLSHQSWGNHLIGLSLIIIITWVVQGASEELLLRGYLLPSLIRRLNLIQGLIVSAIIFALLHMGNASITSISVLNILLCGLALGLMAISEGGIWAVCGFHTAWNMLQGNIFGIAVSGNANAVSLLTTTYTEHNIINGGGFGIEGSLLTTIFMLILIGYYVRKTARHIK